MRMMAQAVMTGDAVNDAIRDGTLGRVMKEVAERWKPEAMYFTTFEGHRSAYIVFDMADSAQMPPFAEPLFGLGAEVTIAPVMNAEDLQKGLSQI